jgi:hypothetical protein
VCTCEVLFCTLDSVLNCDEFGATNDVQMTCIEPDTTDRQHSKRRRPLRPYDRRTRLGRRAVELFRLYRDRLNTTDGTTLALAKRCAELCALAEHVRARMLRGDLQQTHAISRIEDQANGALKRLGLDRVPKKASPSLADYWRRTRAEKPASASAASPGAKGTRHETARQRGRA